MKSPQENGDETHSVERIQPQMEEPTPMPAAEPVSTEAQRNPLPRDRPPVANAQPPKMVNGASLKRMEKNMFPPPAVVTQRRHSAMVGPYNEKLQNGNCKSALVDFARVRTFAEV
ncbi:unnamed protein product [Haemonchus placei]|uniref:Uncharacterized protein n=1 Tax=Haemonchus placei TaxID=6290 RepID=A0A0N4WD06_HAEPC|nr:unnamed protein product [Haemonchus placei]